MLTRYYHEIMEALLSSNNSMSLPGLFCFGVAGLCLFLVVYQLSALSSAAQSKVSQKPLLEPKGDLTRRKPAASFVTNAEATGISGLDEVRSTTAPPSAGFVDSLIL